MQQEAPQPGTLPVTRLRVHASHSECALTVFVQIPVKSRLNSTQECVRLASVHFKGSTKELTFLSRMISGRKMSAVTQINKKLRIYLQVSLTSQLRADPLTLPVSYFPTHQMMLFAARALRRSILTFQNQPNTLKVPHVPAALCFFDNLFTTHWFNV